MHLPLERPESLLPFDLDSFSQTNLKDAYRTDGMWYGKNGKDYCNSCPFSVDLPDDSRFVVLPMCLEQYFSCRNMLCATQQEPFMAVTCWQI